MLKRNAKRGRCACCGKPIPPEMAGGYFCTYNCGWKWAMEYLNDGLVFQCRQCGRYMPGDQSGYDCSECRQEARK